MHGKKQTWILLFHTCSRVATAALAMAIALALAIALTQSAQAQTRLAPVLIGTWVNNSAPYGYTVYTFRTDGTCRHSEGSFTGTIVGHGSTDGFCALSGNVIIMRETHETWVREGAGPPSSNKPTDGIRRLRVLRVDARTLVLVDENLGLENEYERGAEPK